MSSSCATVTPSGFDPFDKSIPELQAALDAGNTSSLALVEFYLARIAVYDQQGPALNAMLYVNPKARDEARAMDAERQAGRRRGPLHGIPIVLKDNFDTIDMPTTSGSLALEGFLPGAEGDIVRRLRDAGAIILGKTNLDEFARGIASVSSLAGQTRNPYDPARNVGGSSGGTAAAVAANFAAVGMGSDTCGSIRIPSAFAHLYGLRATHGRFSTEGMVPLAPTQDVPGPLARTVIDLVTVLDLISTPGGTFRRALDAGALRGARFGALTTYIDGDTVDPLVTAATRKAIAELEAAGAEVVELDIDGLDELLADSSVINAEFPAALAAYLEAREAPIRSVDALLHSGRYLDRHEARYRRSLEAAKDEDGYRRRLAKRETLKATLSAVLQAEQLDALLYPTIRTPPAPLGEAQSRSLCRIASSSGFPAISVPTGFLGDGLPFGLEWLARPGEDEKLVSMAYAWEQLAARREPPSHTPKR